MLRPVSFKGIHGFFCALSDKDLRPPSLGVPTGCSVLITSPSRPPTRAAAIFKQASRFPAHSAFWATHVLARSRIRRQPGLLHGRDDKLSHQLGRDIAATCLRGSAYVVTAARICRDFRSPSFDVDVHRSLQSRSPGNSKSSGAGSLIASPIGCSLRSSARRRFNQLW